MLFRSLTACWAMSTDVKNIQALPPYRRVLRASGGALKDFIIRFVVGGLAVSAFSALGDVLKPKSFAGLFSAAPSIALATLGLTIATNGKLYAATEARSMVAGALAFSLYAYVSSWLMIRRKMQATAVTLAGLGLWLACSLSLWLLVLR